MKVYLAARYTRRASIKLYAQHLEIAGITVTSSWLNQTTSSDSDMDKPDYKLRNYAKRDRADIHAADVLVLFTQEEGKPRSGHHVEYGIASECGKILIVCGPRENIFHYEALQFDTFDLVLAYLKELKDETE